MSQFDKETSAMLGCGSQCSSGILNVKASTMVEQHGNHKVAAIEVAAK